MAKLRNVQITQAVSDGIDDLEIKFYIDRSSGSPVPRVELSFTLENGTALHPNHPLSAITNLTNGQKVTLRNLLTAIRDQVLTLEGFG